jgi:starch synthase (maltosyl-transferring)
LKHAGDATVLSEVSDEKRLTEPSGRSGGAHRSEADLPDGRTRALIENVSPEIDAGRFPIKRVIGEKLVVEADVFADGHDILSVVLRHRHMSESLWMETPMEPLPNDRWRASFLVTELGTYFYTIESWVDRFRTWRRNLEKKVSANQNVRVELFTGVELVRAAADRAVGMAASELQRLADGLSSETSRSVALAIDIALTPRLTELMASFPDRRHATRYSRELRATVDPTLARFGAWYEMFPRSGSREAGRPGTFKEAEASLQRIAEMGFDILYLPPIHPIGRTFRKGKNNSPSASANDPGSPWAIGSAEGGHKAIDPSLGTLADFRQFVNRAREFGIEIALDIAFQCSPDHPYVQEHSDWFRKRPDGSIQYAENPPKKYQDIYPIDFETEDWRELWLELKSVFEFWIERDVRIFRVDNPHTKAFRFWEWCIGQLKDEHPELIFLSEAFTRPKVMYYLAKLGFTQSYNYFPWRNTKRELTDYMTELTQTPIQQYFRPNLWPNTPDILPQYLQYGGRPAFVIRLILAATLGASYGIYGPAFELAENRAREAGSEEYLDSEKYEIRRWDLDAPGNLRTLIGRINRVRKENPALHSNDSLRFHPVNNEQIIAYTKHTESFENVILTIVNLDPHHTQSGWVELELDQFKIDWRSSFQVHDLLTDARYLWNGPKNYVELNPAFAPAHILRIRRHVRTEHDFDYFL